MIRSLNFFVIIAFAMMMCLDVSVALSPLVSRISEHFKVSIKESIKKNEIENPDQMIQWVDYIWSEPTDSSIKNQLKQFKSDHDYESYTVLYVAHMMRETMDELPDNSDDKLVIIDAMKSTLKTKIVPLETYLSINNADGINIYTLLKEQLEEVKNSDSICVLPKYTSSRHHNSRTNLIGQTAKYVNQAYKLYNQVYTPSENSFMKYVNKKPFLKRCGKFLLSFVRIAASTYCLFHGLPISF